MVEQSLFEKYGGFSSVSKVVLAFYDKLLDSDEIGPFFDDVDMSRIVDHQTKFVASLLGGPASYSDKQIQQLHSHLEIANHHFDELETILKSTLEVHGFESEDIDSVIAAFESKRSLIVE